MNFDINIKVEVGWRIKWCFDSIRFISFDTFDTIWFLSEEIFTSNIRIIRITQSYESFDKWRRMYRSKILNKKQLLEKGFKRLIILICSIGLLEQVRYVSHRYFEYINKTIIGIVISDEASFPIVSICVWYYDVWIGQNSRNITICHSLNLMNLVTNHICFSIKQNIWQYPNYSIWLLVRIWH